VDVGKATGGGDVVADEGGEGSTDLGGGQGGGEKSGQDDLEIRAFYNLNFEFTSFEV
jgi:hypothetical protein